MKFVSFVKIGIVPTQDQRLGPFSNLVMKLMAEMAEMRWRPYMIQI